MRHSRAIQRFAKSKLYSFTAAQKAFIDTGEKCSLQTYDRFISDRTFGVKKRILLIPGPNKLGPEVDYIRVGNGVARYMLDGLDEDQYANSPYLTCWLLREAQFPVEVLRKVGAARASGSGGEGSTEVVTTLWGDYERYSSSGNKNNMEGVSNTVMDIFLPLNSPVTSDSLLRIDGKTVDVKEVSRISNLLMVRGIRVGKDEPTTINPKDYLCDLAIDWDATFPEEALTVGVVRSVTLAVETPCQTFVVPIKFPTAVGRVELDNGVGYGLSYGSAYAGPMVRMSLFNAAKQLISTSDNGFLEWTSLTPATQLYVAVCPLTTSETGTGPLLIKGSTS